MSNAFAEEHAPHETNSCDAEQLLAVYIAELRDTCSARLSFDRQTLLKIYELLLIQKIRRDQKGFYAAAYDDVIAESVLRLAEELYVIS